jgi:hypothetical protein
MPLVSVQLGTARAAVKLVLPLGAIQRIPPGTDRAFVRDRVAALGGAPC